MRIADAFKSVHRLFLDTSPIIYYVEQHPHYIDRAAQVFDRIDKGVLEGVTSPVTLAECLVRPYRDSDEEHKRNFIDLVALGHGIFFAPFLPAVAESAAKIRAKHDLGLLDSLQVGAAMYTGCDALLTNDRDFKVVTEIPILILDDLNP